MEKLTRVICCGNPFRGDDAVGLEVFKRLKRRSLPSDVELIDGGTAGIGLLPLFNGCSSVILVDGIIMDKDPGHIQWFLPDDFIAQSSIKISGHEMDLGQVIRICHENSESDNPQTSILGISIKNTDLMHNTISDHVMDGVERATNEIFERLWNDFNEQ